MGLGFVDIASSCRLGCSSRGAVASLSSPASLIAKYDDIIPDVIYITTPILITLINLLITNNKQLTFECISNDNRQGILETCNASFSGELFNIQRDALTIV